MCPSPRTVVSAAAWLAQFAVAVAVAVAANVVLPAAHALAHLTKGER